MITMLVQSGTKYNGKKKNSRGKKKKKEYEEYNKRAAYQNRKVNLQW